MSNSNLKLWNTPQAHMPAHHPIRTATANHLSDHQWPRRGGGSSARLLFACTAHSLLARLQAAKAREDLEHYRNLYEHAAHTLDNTKLELEQQMEGGPLLGPTAPPPPNPI